MSAYTLLSRGEEGFPHRLHDLHPWPNQLHCHGNYIGEGAAVAIVGARAASRSGLQAAYDLAFALASAGHRVISGGALGVDAAAHRGAMAGGGYTAVILGCGLDTYYPARHVGLFERIIMAKGTIISPFEFGYPPLPANFVRRNKVIAALADVVVVVEATAASGSLHTARFASQYHRTLVTYSGSPGCEALIARGVCVVKGAEDVLSILAGQEVEQHVDLPAVGSLEALVLQTLSTSQSKTTSELATELSLSLRGLQRILIGLELKSLVLALPGGLYVRSPLV